MHTLYDFASIVYVSQYYNIYFIWLCPFNTIYTVYDCFPILHCILEIIVSLHYIVMYTVYECVPILQCILHMIVSL